MVTLAVTQYKTVFLLTATFQNRTLEPSVVFIYFYTILLVFNENLISNFSKKYVISKGKTRVVLREKNGRVLSGTQGYELKVG